MNKILVLWATPRSTSTAFEWMMRMRGDFECLHEPFGQAYYCGADRRTTRPEEVEYRPEISYNQTWKDIQARAAQGPVFSKDFPNYIMHMADGQFLDHFQHTFLIRHPRKVLPSMYAHWKSFTLDETSFEALHDMFDLVRERYGAVPPVIDSDDLVADPATVIEAYCSAVGIPFLPDALEWETGDREEVTWYGGPWHDSLKQSTGLAPQQRDYADIGDVPLLTELYEACLPHYEALHRDRIRP